jgi:RNA polymerase sigma factor (sigma-70 family)
MENVATTFDADKLKGLSDKSGLSYIELSKLTGISLSSISNYMRGATKPKFQQILTLADFFAVPVDYLIGRMDLDMTDYGKYYMKLRRGQYEDYIRKGRELHIPKGAETPYPYNLLDEVIRDRWESVLNADQEAGLEHVLSTLTEREQQAIAEYFWNGGTLESTAKLWNVTKERARQIIAKAVRKLRHPMRLKIIKYGLDGWNRRKAIEQEDLMLDEQEAMLIHRRAIVEQLIEEKQETKREITIEDMELSVRAYNCLGRAGIRTLNDLLDYARKNGEEGLYRIRNLGRKSLVELYEKADGLRQAVENYGND